MLYIQFLTRGLEILILRIGLPLACVGLMDNDNGIFRSYIQKFFQSTMAVLVQIVLAKLGVALMLNTHVFWGLAALVTSSARNAQCMLANPAHTSRCRI